MEKINTINSFLDFVTEDTEINLLEWDVIISGNITTFTTEFQIKKTDKYLSFKLNVDGKNSYITVYYFMHPALAIPFDKIKYSDSPEKMENLIKLIYTQITQKDK